MSVSSVKILNRSEVVGGRLSSKLVGVIHGGYYNC
jgi:hypothetical protein